MIDCKYIQDKGIAPKDQANKDKIDKFKECLSDGEAVGMILLSKDELVSHKQLKFYWKVIMPTALWFLDDLTQYGNNVKAAHTHLKLWYCKEVDVSLATIINFNGKTHAQPFSLKLAGFEDSGVIVANRTQRTSYRNWVEEKIMIITGKDIEQSHALYQASL